MVESKFFNIIIKDDLPPNMARLTNSPNSSLAIGDVLWIDGKIVKIDEELLEIAEDALKEMDAAQERH